MSFSFIYLYSLFSIKSNKKLLKISLGLIFVGFVAIDLFCKNWAINTRFFIPLEALFDLGPYFIMGSLLSCFEWETLPVKNTTAIIMLVTLLFATYTNWGHTSVYFTLPFLVIYIGKKTNGFATWVHEKLGDPSYGIYLYAFPLQQFIIYLYRPSTLLLFVLSTIGAFIFGYFSWKFIEKKALAFKQYFIQKK